MTEKLRGLLLAAAVLTFVGVSATVGFYSVHWKHTAAAVEDSKPEAFLTATLSDDGKFVQVLNANGALLEKFDSTDTRFSPDRSRFLYTFDNGGIYDTLMMELGKATEPWPVLQLGVHQILRGGGIRTIAWSPDSKFVAIHFGTGYSPDPTEIRTSNETVVVDARTNEVTWLAKIMRQAIDKELSVRSIAFSGDLHKQMRDRNVDVSWPDWVPEGLWLDCNYARYPKQAFQAIYEPEPKTVDWVKWATKRETSFRLIYQ